MRAAYAKGTGVLFFTGHFGFWELHAIVHALQLRADRRAGAGARQPRPERRCSRTCASAPATRVIYRQGAVRRVLKTLADGPGRGDADRSAHAQPRRDLGGLLPAAGGDDVDAGGAGAAHRRAGGPGVRRAAAGRPLSHDLRARRWSRRRRARPTRSASSRSAAPTCSRCTCAGSPSCGCGCTAAGATRRRRRRAGCSRSVRDDGAQRCLSAPGRVVVAAPNWLGDAVMALPALRRGAGASRRRRTSPWRRAERGAAVRDGAGRRRRDSAGRRGAPVARPAAWRADAARLAAERLRPGAAVAELVHVGVDRGAGRHPRALGLRRRRARPPADARACRGRRASAAPGRLLPGARRGARACRRCRAWRRSSCPPPRAQAARRCSSRHRRPAVRRAGAGRRLRPRQAVAARALRRAGAPAVARARPRRPWSSAPAATPRPAPSCARRCGVPRRPAGADRADRSRRPDRPGRRSPACSRARTRSSPTIRRDAPGRRGRHEVVAVFGATNEHQTSPLGAGARRPAAARSSPTTSGAGRVCCASARSITGACAASRPRRCSR